MKTAILCIVCYGAGVLSVGIPLLLLLTHRPRYVAPTLRRRNGDKQVPEVVPPAENGVDYRFINLTGLEGE
jgi:hypothetical protein